MIMTNKKILTPLLVILMTSINTIQAQNSKPFSDAFKHLDLDVTIGSTGFGVDVISPVYKDVQVRAGFEIMPRFEQNMIFDIQGFDEKGNKTESKFEKMSEKLESLTGYKADNEADHELADKCSRR